MGCWSGLASSDLSATANAVPDTFRVALAMTHRLLLVALLCQADAAASSGRLVPSGWMQRSVPTEDELRCASFSTRRWLVYRSNSDVEISALRGQRVVQDLPFAVDYTALGVPAQANRLTFSYDDGWLVGLSAGEFGGGLWWFDSDGRRRVKLSDASVRSFVAVGDRLLVAIGYAHGTRDSGKLIEISDAGGQPRARHFADLPASPETAAEGPDGSILVSTTQGLFRVEVTGTLHQLTRKGYAGLYPSSMVRLDDGVVYIGMRGFVVRLVPKDGDFVEEWLVPEDCNEFRMSGLECVCGDKPSR